MLSPRSTTRLKTCHMDIQAVVRAVAERTPLTVICGHRGEAEQMVAFLAGTSKLKYPHSRHNTMPSEAVDIAPLTPQDDGHYIIQWSRWQVWVDLAAIVREEAARLGIALEWGGDWKMRDGPHWQMPA